MKKLLFIPQAGLLTFCVLIFLTVFLASCSEEDPQLKEDTDEETPGDTDVDTPGEKSILFSEWEIVAGYKKIGITGISLETEGLGEELEAGFLYHHWNLDSSFQLTFETQPGEVTIDGLYEASSTYEINGLTDLTFYAVRPYLIDLTRDTVFYGKIKYVQTLPRAIGTVTVSDITSTGLKVSGSIVNNSGIAATSIRVTIMELGTGTQFLSYLITEFSEINGQSNFSFVPPDQLNSQKLYDVKVDIVIAGVSTFIGGVRINTH